MKNIFSVLLLAASVDAHTCVHDHIDHGSQSHRHETTVAYHSTEDGIRELSESAYSNMRFKWRMGNIDALTAEQATYLEEKILTPAAKFWSESLQVVPVAEPFFFSPCISSWQFDPPLCYQVEATPKCGDVEIPAEFLPSETKYCDGCMSTTGSSCCRSRDDCGTCNTVTSNTSTGVQDTDFLILVNAIETEKCGGSTVAYAATCLRDQLDRPIAGYINFCPQDLFGSSNSQKQQDINNFKVGVHELGHALGFSSSSFHLFRKATGEYRSAQNAVSYQCNGGTYSYTPPTNSIEKFSERGITKEGCPYGLVGESTALDLNGSQKCVLKMTTEAVKREAQAFFGCADAQGAELENQHGTCSLIGSHMEQRVYNYDIMSPMPLEYDEFFVSPVTLAFFEDSGWYKVNYTVAAEHKSTEVWGEGLGCNFLREPCINSTTQDPLDSQHFCSSGAIRQCAVGRLTKGVCGLTSYNEALPSQFQYFQSDQHGGYNTYADYCPIVSSQGPSGNCRFPSAYPDSLNNYQGEVFSDQSRCFEGSLKAVIGSKTLAGDESRASCYRVTNCGATSYSLWVSDPNTGKEVMVACDDTDESPDHSVAGFQGKVTCAPSASVCTRSLLKALHPTSSPIPSPTTSPSTPAPTPNATTTTQEGVNTTSTLPPTRGSELNDAGRSSLGGLSVSLALVFTYLM